MQKREEETLREQVNKRKREQESKEIKTKFFNKEKKENL